MTNSGDREKLSFFVERVVALETERRAAADDIKEELKAAKEAGFSPATIRAIAKLKLETREQREKRVAREDEVDQYKSALGMLD